MARFGVGEATRIGGASRLVARRWDFDGIAGAPFGFETMFLGIVGTGGASGALGTAADGDGSRNVRSVIDPELPFRCSAGGREPETDPAVELPNDDADPLLRIVLFV